MTSIKVIFVHLYLEIDALMSQVESMRLLIRASARNIEIIQCSLDAMENSTYSLFSAELILLSRQPVPVLIVLIGCAMVDFPTTMGTTPVPTAARCNGGEVDVIVTAVGGKQGCPLRVGGMSVLGRGGICCMSDSLYHMEFKLIVKVRARQPMSHGLSARGRWLVEGLP